MRSNVAAALIAAAPAPAPAQTQAQMTADAAAQYKAADAAMTAVWRQVRAAMRARDAANTSRGGGFGYAAATLASQRAWLAFRDRECLIQSAEFAGGTIQPMARLRCLAKLTRARTAQLRTLLGWQR